MKKEFDLAQSRAAIREQWERLESRLHLLEGEVSGRNNGIAEQRPLVFGGPSLAIAGPAASDFEIRPPIQRGDLPLAVLEGYRWIGIVDGVFHQEPSVSLQEIRFAIERGTRPYGSSSMGALRAVEAAPLGMIGVGKIYEWYRDEKIDSDDEVAVCFDAAGAQTLGFPLVNLRATLEREERLSAPIRHLLLEQAIALHYTERRIESLLKRLSDRIGPEEILRIETALAECHIDQKAEDAKRLLARMKEDYAASLAHGTPAIPD